MPIISFDYDDFATLLGLMIPREELIDRMPMIGADIADAGYEEWNVEFFPDRPDLYSVEGIARALKNFLCDEDEIKETVYTAEDSGIICEVDPAVNDVRPYISCAKVTGVYFSDQLITSLMNVQEKLHLTVGRKRVKVAIGVHDITPVKPPIYYNAVDPKSVIFIPLEETEAWDLQQILRRHKKGRDYAFVLEGFDKYPIITDSFDQVLSFPPIINGELTKVKEDTKDLFIDVTGTSEKAVNNALNIICTLLAERGAQIHTVKIKYPDREVITPDLEPKKMTMDIEECNGWLGTKLSDDEIKLALRRMSLGIGEVKDGQIEVLVPPYRADIIHPVDLMEDVIIGYGFERIEPTLPKAATFGKLRKVEKFTQRLRGVYLGLGFNEVTTLCLSNEADQFENMGREQPEDTEFVKITNPISKDHTMLRSYLMPSLLNILRANKHRELPQQIFEVGTIVPKDAKNHTAASALLIDSRADFTRMKSIAESVLQELYLDYTIVAQDVGPYIKGRSGVVKVGDKVIGDFGEIDPSTISAFELGNPIIGMNLDVDAVLKIMSE